MSLTINDNNYFFIPPNNKNGLSTSLPSDFHKAKSFEFICDVEVDVEKMNEFNHQGYLMCLNGKHLGVFAGTDYIGVSLWTEHGEEKVEVFPKDMKRNQRIHFVCNLEKKYFEIKNTGNLWKDKKHYFEGELVSDYRFSYLWIGCGNGFNDDARFQFYGKLHKVEVIKNNKTIFKTDFKQKTKFKVFDQSNCGNHLIKYDKEWFE